MGTCSSTGLLLMVTGLPLPLGWIPGSGWDKEELSLELKTNEGEQAQKSKVTRPSPHNYRGQIWSGDGREKPWSPRTGPLQSHGPGERSLGRGQASAAIPTHTTFTLGLQGPYQTLCLSPRMPEFPSVQRGGAQGHISPAPVTFHPSA